MELFGLYESISSLEALLGDFGDFDFGPETEFSTLTKMINFQVFFNFVGGNFLRIFLRFYRGVLIKKLRMSHRLSNLVKFVDSFRNIFPQNHPPS